MNLTIRWVDVTPNLKSGEQPVLLLERPLLHGNKPKGGLFANAEVARKGKYWTPTSPLNTNEVEWSCTDSGKHVRVPLQAYLTPERALSHIMAIGFEIGMRAMLSFREKTKEEIDEVSLVLAHECHDLASDGRDAYRCCVGVTIKVKGK